MTEIATATLATDKLIHLDRHRSSIFRKSIVALEGNPQVGDWIVVEDEAGTPLAYGFFEGGDGTYPYVQLLSFAPPREVCNIAIEGSRLIAERLTTAFRLRQEMRIFDPPINDSYRLCYGKGDALPGLAIDVYGATALLQIQSAGMYRHREEIAQTLLSLPSAGIVSVFDRSSSTLFPSALPLFVEDGFVSDNRFEEKIASENGIRFMPDWQHSAKLQWSFERRELRELVGRYAQRRRVLDLYASIGGNTLYALRSGAQEVVSIDHSPRAVERCCYHIALNEMDSTKHSYHVEDSFAFLERSEAFAYDFILLDPPSFAQDSAFRKRAIKGYKRLNRLALEKIAPRGMLLTVCSSRSIEREEFVRLVDEMALLAGRRVSILRTLSPSQDFPIPLATSESSDLFKGLLLFVE